nr:MAG TPA: hypothetical protein [Caudoviricetes sp.]
MGIRNFPRASGYPKPKWYVKIITLHTSFWQMLFIRH